MFRRRFWLSLLAPGRRPTARSSTVRPSSTSPWSPGSPDRSTGVVLASSDPRRAHPPSQRSPDPGVPRGGTPRKCEMSGTYWTSTPTPAVQAVVTTARPGGAEISARSARG